jgi:ABC-type Fe3+-hydroxamate transport system substrate-binding protein
MMDEIGKITGKGRKALEIQNNVREQFSHLKLEISSVAFVKTSVLYLIWRKPYIAAGTNTFINHLLSFCGFNNALQKALLRNGMKRYPEISADEIHTASPGYIFLSSEPYPFRQKHIHEFQSICPHAKVVLVDGEMFSWYGSRLLYAPAYFGTLLKNL